LLALGAGLAGAQNLGQGLSRGFAMAGPAQQQDIQQQRINASYQAIKSRLLSAGMSPDDAHQTAMAATGNPKPIAPASRARLRIRSSGKAVMKMIGVWLPRAINRLCNSTPLRPGICTSEMTQDDSSRRSDCR
jgi:hypothetical protein